MNIKTFLSIFILNFVLSKKTNIKIQNKGNYYFIQSQVNKFQLNSFIKDATHYEKDQIYYKRLAKKDGLLVNIPKNTKNLLVSTKNCIVPIICLKKKRFPFLRFLSDNKFAIKCHKTNFDFLGFKHIEATTPEKNYDIEFLEENLLQHSILNEELDSHKIYKALFYCVHSHKKNWNLKMEFIDNHVFQTISFFKQKNVFYETKNMPLHLTKNKNYLITFPDKMDKLSLKWELPLTEGYLVWIKYFKDNKYHIKHFNKKKFIIKDISDVEIKIINFDKEEIFIDFSYKAFYSKSMGFKLIDKMQNSNDFLLITTLSLILFCSVFFYFFYYKVNEKNFLKKYFFKRNNPNESDSDSNSDSDSESEKSDNESLEEDSSTNSPDMSHIGDDEESDESIESESN